MSNLSKSSKQWSWAALILAALAFSGWLHVAPNRKYARVFSHWGQEYLEKQDLSRAENYLRRAIYFDPGYARTFQSLGVLSHQRRDLPTAINYVQKARELEPQNGDISNHLGEMYLESEDPDKAVDFFEEAIHKSRHAHNAAQYRFNLGLALLKRGDAVSAFEQVKLIRQADQPVLARELERKVEAFLGPI